MKRLIFSGILLAVALCFGISEAVSTKLVVRARSKDAKFVGTSMGGARVVIKDSESGEVLAEGLTSGPTGDTQRIMIEPQTRYGNIAEGAAKFETSIDIDEPKLVTIEVTAPYGMKPDVITSSTQAWLIPGKDIDGEGLIVEVPGFAVDAMAPATVRLVKNQAAISVETRVVMI